MSNNSETADFRTIVETHQDRVLNICYAFLHNREDAEDAAQDVFIEVYRSLDRFRGEAQLSTWIHRISVTKSLDMIRRKKRKKRITSAKQILGLGEAGAAAAGSAGEQPDRQLEAKENRELLYRAIDRLPETQKIALTLSAIEGLRYKETAAVMQTSVESVESLIFRAKKNIRKHLAGYFRKTSR